MTTVRPARRLGSILAGALLVAACGRPEAATPTGSGPPAGLVAPTQALTHGRAAPPTPPTSAGCPALSPPLATVVAAPEPATAAARAGLVDADGRVPIAVRLAAEDGDHVDLALRHGLEVRRRATGWVEARAPLSALCALASDPRVGRVQALDAPGAAG